MTLAPDIGRLLDAVRTLSWPSARRVHGARTGAHRSRLRGRAPELSEYRAYRQGDDPRDLDWKLLARSDRPFVRLSDDRAIHETWLVLDASASMAYPSESMAKWNITGAIALALASIASRASDPVACIIAAEDRVIVQEPSTRRDLVARLQSIVNAARVGGAREVHEALVAVPERARLVLITDLLGDSERTLRLIAARAAAGGETIVLHVLSQDELAMPEALTYVADPERPTFRRHVDAVARDAYEAGFARFIDDQAAQLNAIGVRHVRVIAEEPAEHAVRRVVASTAAESTSS